MNPSLLAAVILILGLSGACWGLYHRTRRLRTQLRERMISFAELKTERHLALITEQSRQQALLDAMVEGVLLLDEKWAIEHANPAAQRQFKLRHVVFTVHTFEWVATSIRHFHDVVEEAVGINERTNAIGHAARCIDCFPSTIAIFNKPCRMQLVAVILIASLLQSLPDRY